MDRKNGAMLPKQSKIASAVVTVMLLSAGTAHAAGANFVDRGNPNQAAEDCINGVDPNCTKTSTVVQGKPFVAVSSAAYAAGKDAIAGDGGVAIGDRANANGLTNADGKGGAIAIGTGAQAINNSATALGTVAIASGNTAIAMGRQSAATGNFSTAIGNVSNASGERSIAFGNSAQASGDQAIAIGSSTGTKGDGVSPGAFFDGTTNTQANGKRSLAIGSGARTDGDDQVSIGSNSVGLDNNTTPTFGQAAPVGGAVSFGGAGLATTKTPLTRQLKNVAAGADDTDAVNVAQVKYVQKQLQDADALNVKYDTNPDGSRANSVTFGGTGATVPVSLHNVADGAVTAWSTDAVNGEQLHHATQSAANNFGGGSTADEHGNITAPTYVLGADAQGNTTYNNVGAALSNIDGRTTKNTTDISTLTQNINNGEIGLVRQDKATGNITVAAATGGTNVNFAGTAGDRVLSGVAQGVKGNDAVNVDQLSGVKSVADNANKGWNISANSGAATQVKPGDTVDFSGDQNIAVSKTDKGIGVALNTDLKGLNSVQVGGATGPKLSASGLDNGGKQITNVASGGNVDSNAANIGDVKAAISGAADPNAVKYDADSNKGTVTLAGANGTKISNVAAGTLSPASTDAVNGSQLYATNQSIQTALDGGKVDQNGNVVAPVYNVTNNAGNAVQVSNVKDAIETVDGRVTNVTNQINNGEIGLVRQDQTSRAITVAAGTDGGVVNFANNAGETRTLAGVTAGKNDTDAVNVKQLKDNISSSVGTAVKNAVTYDTNADGSRANSVTLTGGDASKPVALSNVAAGALNTKSTDAVNGSQLYATNQSIQTALNGGTLNPDGSVAQVTYNVKGADGSVVNATNVKQAFDTVDARVTTVEGDVTNIINGKAGLVQQAAPGANLTVGAKTDGTAVDFGGTAGARQLKNVAAGKDDTDGVNVKQLKDSVSSGVNNGSTNAVLYDTDKDGNRLNSVSLIGSNGSAVVINNVAAGAISADSKQAVNGSQLLANATSTLGGGTASVTTVNNVTQVTYQVGDGKGGTTTVNGVGGAIQNLDQRTTKIENNVQQVVDGKAGLVQQQDKDAAITVGKDTGGKTVDFTNNAGDARVLTGVADGKIASGSKDAVNGGQLNQVIQTIDSNNRITVQSVEGNTKWIARADAGSFGSTATATGKNSVAVGQGSVADRDNSFSVGAAGNERQVTNVAAGTAPTDAVNVKQLNENLQKSQAYTDQRVGQLYNGMDSLRKDMYGGVASAMAVAGLPQSPAAGKAAVSAAYANYQGHSGFAVGGSYLTENARWVIKAGVTGNDRSGAGVTVGAAYVLN